MIIRQDSGLCNRLRVAFSWYQAALRDKEPLTVVWEPNTACPGFFLDYFEPVPGMHFVDSEKKVDGRVTIVANTPHCPYADIVTDCHPDFHHKNHWIYEQLKPLPHLKARVAENVAACENRFLAVHIRRTDIVSIADIMEDGKCTTDEQFAEFIETHNSYNIYVATDNRATQDELLAKYPERIKGMKLIDNTNRAVVEALQRKPGQPWERLPGPSVRFRHTGLADAVVDLFTCVEAAHFKGSGWSSFSYLIVQCRTNKTSGP